MSVVRGQLSAENRPPPAAGQTLRVPDKLPSYVAGVGIVRREQLTADGGRFYFLIVTSSGVFGLPSGPRERRT